MFGPDLWRLVSHGGYSLLIILFCSLLAVAVAVERIIVMWGSTHRSKSLAEQVAKSLLRGDLAQARALCERSQALSAEVFLAGFARQGQGAKDFEGAIERERVAVTLRLKSNLWLLGTVGTISPFVGLFGTVIGIQTAFGDMADAGTGGFVVVANGIKGALVATAAGIAVAVLAVILYNYFQTRLGRITAELKLLADEFIELLKEAPPGQGQSGAASNG